MRLCSRNWLIFWRYAAYRTLSHKLWVITLSHMSFQNQFQVSAEKNQKITKTRIGINSQIEIPIKASRVFHVKVIFLRYAVLKMRWTVRFDLDGTGLQNFFQYLVENCVGPPVNNYYPNYREADEDLETYEDDFECPDGEPNCRNCAISYFCALNTGF